MECGLGIQQLSGKVSDGFLESAIDANHPFEIFNGSLWFLSTQVGLSKMSSILPVSLPDIVYCLPIDLISLFHFFIIFLLIFGPSPILN